MEFLKNHYEKLILGLTLLLMAAGAVVLVLEAGTVQEELAEFRKLIVENEGKPPAKEDGAARGEIIKRAANPSQTDFVQVHRVFNPAAWYVDPDNNLIPGTKVGVSQLVVHSITPQFLKLEFAAMGGTPERPSLSMNVIREFQGTPQGTNRTRRSVTLNATNMVANASLANTLDPVRKLVLLARETSGPAENPEVKCELHEPGKDPLKFTLSKAQGYTHVVEYVAYIQYMVETNFVWKAARKDTQLIFAGDTNIVVEITATNVILRAISNDKTTTLPLGSPRPAASPTKTP